MSTDETPERARFRAACAEILGHYYPGTDRELALAALAVMVAKTPADAPLDQALRSFVVAVRPLMGAPTAREIPVSPEQLRPVKRKALADALSIGSAIVVFDATIEGVDVHPMLRGVRDAKLRLGYDLKPPIYDLDLDDDGWSGVLTFGGVPCPCFVPWDAVWAVGSEVTQQGLGWPQSAPEGFEAGPKEEKPAEKARPKLELVSTPGEKTSAAPVPVNHAQRPHLVLVPEHQGLPTVEDDYERIDKTVPELEPGDRHNGRLKGFCALDGCASCTAEMNALEPTAFAYSPGMDDEPDGAA